ncbi:MAG: pilus assembly protein TadG-related protein, partial [Pyrinomonadaceae bacterium]
MRKHRLGKTQERRGERGSILATSAIGMLSFILAAGLAVDISHLYLAKNELQNAADAAALAGASGLNFNSSGIAIASARAMQEMNKYDFANNDVEIQAVDVRFARNLSDFENGTDMSAGSAVGVASQVRFVKVKT